jgi:hypothetical protein
VKLKHDGDDFESNSHRARIVRFRGPLRNARASRIVSNDGRTFLSNSGSSLPMASRQLGARTVNHMWPWRQASRCNKETLFSVGLPRWLKMEVVI